MSSYLQRVRVQASRPWDCEVIDSWRLMTLRRKRLN